jgi:hypothetical protein
MTTRGVPLRRPGFREALTPRTYLFDVLQPTGPTPIFMGSGGTLTRSFCSVMVFPFDSTGRQRPFGHRYPSRNVISSLY